MKKNLFFIAITFFIISCSSSRVITSKKENKGYHPKTKTEKAVVEKETTQMQPTINIVPKTITNKVEKYIYQYKNIAQYQMQKYGVPASITLAQGILESGVGEGSLAKRANNHFGIKCHNWKGKKIYHDDDKKGECFRKYNNPADSYKDHSLFLTNRSRYAFLFELQPTNYRGWAKGLKRAGYATDPKYPQKLISLINRYQLNQYDSLKINKKPVGLKNKIYTVQKGDNLFKISKQFNVSVAQLKKINKILDNTINEGQQLIIP